MILKCGSCYTRYVPSQQLQCIISRPISKKTPEICFYDSVSCPLRFVIGCCLLQTVVAEFCAANLKCRACAAAKQLPIFTLGL